MNTQSIQSGSIQSRIRADHVGSLLRPQSLLDARAQLAAGKLTAQELHAAEDCAILDILKMQQETGIQVFSDGEYRRAGWYDGFRAAVAGFQPFDRTMPAIWKGEHAAMAAQDMKKIGSFAVGTKLKLQGRFTDVEAKFLKERAPRPYKITIPSPASFQQFFEPGLTDKVYPDRDAMLADIVSIYKQEMAALVADGVPYVQIDTLRYGEAIDPERSRRWEERGVSSMQIVDQTLAADNAVLALTKGTGITRAMHICRGNHRSAWAGQGSYEAVAERMFGQLDVDRFLLEFDDERSGGFEPLRFIPKGKTVVLGLVTTKSGKLESADELKRRIDAAAKFVPLENLALGTQCGFASTELGNLLTMDDQRRKLTLIAETARKIWG